MIENKRKRILFLCKFHAVCTNLKRSQISTALMPEVFGREFDIPMNLHKKG